MTNRSAPAARPLLAATGLIFAILAVAAGLPLASRVIDLLSRALFGDIFLGPALSQLILLAVGLTAFAIALHRALRPLTGTDQR
ncbi:hypothetical protein [Streptomyces sp. NPDC058623]|uniref:hypothetical protein n=1 Tax=Streptomyces sp. NPDC058623 TaxID=3346563 RepID=UPI0036475659